MKVKITVLSLALLNFASTTFSSEEREEPYGSRMLLLPRPGTRTVATYDPIGEFGACLSELERLCISAKRIDDAADPTTVTDLKNETLEGIKTIIGKMGPIIHGMGRMGYPDKKIKDFEESYKQYRTQISLMIDLKEFEFCMRGLITNAEKIKNAF